MHTHTFCPAATSFPFALSCPSTTGKDQHLSSSPPSSSPSFLFPPPPPSSFLRLCLIYPFLSDKVSRDERHLLRVLWRCNALLNYMRGQGLVCIQWHGGCIVNRWWERTCMAVRLINKIYYDNATEMWRRDVTIAKLACSAFTARDRSRFEAVDIHTPSHRHIHMHINSLKHTSM